MIADLEVDRFIRSTKIHLSSGWQSAATTRLTVDMSIVEFMDYRASARLLVLLEGCVRHGAELEVVLPAQAIIDGELNALQTDENTKNEIFHRRLSSAISGRRKCLSFLTTIGFLNSVTMPHLATGNVAVRPAAVVDRIHGTLELDAIFAQDRAAVSRQPESEVREALKVLPFRWVGPEDVAMPSPDDQPERNVTPWQQELVNFLYGGGLLATRRDALSLESNAVGELVDNVFEHAPDGAALPTPGALVGGIAFREARFLVPRRPGKTYANEQDFTDWARKQSAPAVRLIVADSGRGLSATLGETFRRHLKSTAPRSTTALVHYAFRASASSLRGPRRGLGLPSVERAARGYGGRVAMRTDNALAGSWFPDWQRKEISAEPLAYAPGTVVELTIGTTNQTRARIESTTRSAPAREEGLCFGYVKLTVDDVADVALKAVVAERTTRPLVVLVCTGWPESRRDRTVVAERIRRGANDMIGQGVLVVVLPEASRSELETTFAPLDDIAEGGARSQTVWDLPEWTDPCLLIAADGSHLWTGGSEAVRGLLYALVEHGEIPFPQHLEQMARRTAEHDFLSADRRWFAVAADRATFRVSLATLEEFASDKLAQQFARALRREALGLLEV